MAEEEELKSIGEVAKELGITTRTLRFWDEVGIIEASPRSSGSNRFFTPYMVRRIKFIIKLKELGLSIKEMQHLYEYYGQAKRTDKMIPQLVTLLDEHVKQIDAKIEKLSSLREDIVTYREHIKQRAANMNITTDNRMEQGF